MSFVLQQNKESNLFTLSAAIGTPPQASRLLIDLNSSATTVFTISSVTMLTRPDKFYSKTASSTSNYLQSATLFTSDSSGFHFQTQLTNDLMCVDLMCYDTLFQSVIKLS